jgi:hypothetical protein
MHKTTGLGGWLGRLAEGGAGGDHLQQRLPRPPLLRQLTLPLPRAGPRWSAPDLSWDVGTRHY